MKIGFFKSGYIQRIADLLPDTKINTMSGLFFRKDESLEVFAGHKVFILSVHISVYIDGVFV